MTRNQSVTLVIATYNRGASIARTLDSVTSQTRPADEVVVVDDCSSDGTGDWVRRHYPRMRVVRTHRNLYTSGARNFGARQAQGDVLVFLDHDDELTPHALETLVGLLETHGEARAAHADHVTATLPMACTFPTITTPNALRPLASYPSVALSALSARVYGRAMYKALLWGNLLQQPWAIYRHEFLSLGGFAEDVATARTGTFTCALPGASRLCLATPSSPATTWRAKPPPPSGPGRDAHEGASAPAARPRVGRSELAGSFVGDWACITRPPATEPGPAAPGRRGVAISGRYGTGPSTMWWPPVVCGGPAG